MTPAPPPPPLPTIKGLPEGIELLHIGLAQKGDFELINEIDEKGQPVARIYPGPRIGASSGLIVKPADGYTFVADVKPADGYTFVADIRNMCYRVAKKFPAPLTITVHPRFVVETQMDADAVNEQLEKLKKLPGYSEE